MRSGKAVSASVALLAAALALVPALAPAARAGELVLATSQLGFKPDSPKTLTLVAPEEATPPDRIPFYIHQAGYRLPREQKKPGLWADAPYGYPFDPLKETYGEIDPSMYLYKSRLTRRSTRWGVVWQADFSDFDQKGLFQAETEVQFSLPLSVSNNPYERFMRGYMVYLRSQRSGFAVAVAQLRRGQVRGTDRPGAITHQAEIVEGPALRLVSPTAWGLVRLPEDERSPEDVAARLRTR